MSLDLFALLLDILESASLSLILLKDFARKLKIVDFFLEAECDSGMGVEDSCFTYWE